MLPAGEAWGPGTLSIFLGLEEATHLCTVPMPRVLAGVSSELPGRCDGSSHSCAHRGRCGEKAGAIRGLRTVGTQGQDCRRLRKAWIGRSTDGLMGSCLTGGCCALIRCSMEGLEMAVKAQTLRSRSATCRRPRTQPWGRASGFEGVGNTRWGLSEQEPPHNLSQCSAGTPLRRSGRSPCAQTSMRPHGHFPFQIVRFLPSNRTAPRVDCAFLVSDYPRPSWYC